MEQLTLEGLGYKLISINLYHLDTSHKHLLLNWLRQSPNVLIVSIDYLYRAQATKVRCIITDNKYTELKSSIHKIVFKELKPITIINNNYQLNKDNISDYTTKVNRTRNCNHNHINSITNS